MPAGKYSFTCEKGATFSYSIKWKRKDTGVPFDVTGYTGRMLVKSSYSSTEAIVEFSSALGNMVFGGDDGKITISLDAEVTQELPANNPTGTPPTSTYLYDWEITSPSGKITRLLQGKFLVVEEITR